MPRHIFRGLGPLLAAGLALVACASDGTPATAQPAPPPVSQSFEGAAWRLAELDGRAIAPGPREAYVQFDAASGRVSGSGGCNRIAGSYRLGGGSLTLGPLISTRMACLDPQASATETRFLAVLEATAGYRLEGRRLILTDGAGMPLAVLEEATKR
ncbi:META domain-containing protein [Roseomonas sp. OT10]|uniref:META domain-containing protein n=1 Tax=Roseomonas cutis TaxID=2897332 RepID=UPI001E5102AC|nr:META domain-containing protein [Roseomonas sp. OT10]UFN47625.1 META domain-containing protein [Roseomonas sp. OT10]